MKMNVRALFSLVLALILLLSATNISHAFEVKTTITTGSSPSGITYDSVQGEIFITSSLENGAVSVISDKTNTVVATIPVGEFPACIAYDPDRGEVFVANSLGNGVSAMSVISDSTDQVLENITLGIGNEGTTTVTYDSGKGEMFITTEISVLVLSDVTNTVLTSIPTGNHPGGITYDLGKGEIFVTQEGNNTVLVISDVSNKVVATVTTGTEGGVGAVYDSAKGEVFVTNYDDQTVSVISDSNNSVVATVPVGEAPQDVAYDPNRGEIFVACALSDAVYVISDTTDKVIATIPLGTIAGALTYDSGMEEIFITNGHFNNMGEPDNMVLVLSDTSNLTAPQVSPSPETVNQGQASNLNSSLITTGVSPYAYHWFSEAPGASSYSPVNSAASPNYKFSTSTSTAIGNWTFILEVTDASETSVNSTATVVTVNAAPLNTPTLSPSPTISGSGTKDLIIAMIVIISIAIIAVALLLRTRAGKRNET